jgi:hypothetical protein
MKPFIDLVDRENRAISAIYRCLMVGAKVVLVDRNGEEPLPDPVAVITSPFPSGSLRIKVPASVKSGAYYLKVLNCRGEPAARSGEFHIT